MTIRKQKLEREGKRLSKRSNELHKTREKQEEGVGRKEPWSSGYGRRLMI